MTHRRWSGRITTTWALAGSLTDDWTVNLDGYYKDAKNLVDLGQFGSAVILAPYNYAHGTVYGGEISSTYKAGPVSMFGNFGYVETRAHDINSQQFEFDADELAYIRDHEVHLTMSRCSAPRPASRMHCRAMIRSTPT